MASDAQSIGALIPGRGLELPPIIAQCEIHGALRIPLPCWRCDEERRQKQDDYNRKMSVWKENVRPEYRTFDIDKAVNRRATQRVIDWQYGPRGIIAIGPTGQGKTFAMCELIRRQIRADHRVKCLTVFDFALGVAEAQSKFELPFYIQQFYFNGVLFLDELGQSVLGEQAEGCLFDIIDKRIGFQHPTLFASNYTGDTLQARFRDQRGAPTVRRIREFNEQIVF